MPHDRRTGRVLLAMLGLVGVAMSIGCMRSSILRSSAGSVPELSPSGELHPVAGDVTPGTTSTATATASTSWSRNPAIPPARPSADAGPDPARPPASPSQAGLASSPAPTATDTLDAPAPGGPSSVAPAPAGELPAPPTTMPTPLLDAEIRRAQSVNRQHIESLKAADAPAPSSPPIDAPTDRPATTPTPATTAGPKSDDPDPEVFAPLPLAASPRVADKSEPGGIAVPPLIPIDRSTDGTVLPVTMPPPLSLARDSQASSADKTPAVADAPEVDRRADEPKPNRSESVIPDEPGVAVREIGDGPAASGGPAVQPHREERPPLKIAALQLCSHVRAFGDVEPVNPDALQPGHPVLVYCEMAGLEYQAHGDAFVSRLAAHFELRPGTDGPIVWEQAPKIAKDLCHRPRRDYYVSYVVEFPRSLEPGPYRLRLIQTDLVGNRAASGEIPVTIVR